jgi:hypothetical protein
MMAETAAGLTGRRRQISRIVRMLASYFRSDREPQCHRREANCMVFIGWRVYLLRDFAAAIGGLLIIEVHTPRCRPTKRTAL